MAMPVLNPPPVPNPQANTNPPAPPASTDNYLSRCVTELSPETIAAHESNSILFSVAAKVWLAGFIILAVGAFIATGVFTPIYLPIAAVAAFCLKYPAWALYEQLTTSSRQMQDVANSLKHVAQRFRELPNEPRLLAMRLASMSILWNSIQGVQEMEQLEPLKPLIARYDYWIDHKVMCEAKATKRRTAAQELGTQLAAATAEQRPELEQKIRNKRYKILDAEHQALACKVQAAFTHAVIMQPTFAGEFDTLATFAPTNIQDRAVARAFNDTALANNFVEFSRSNVRALTIDDVKTQPITVLAQRFIEAMPAA